ncbi:MAG: hypothetical protein IPN96_14845 [Anaerolineales bacterium]|nr:hypothetical protein [Anaerolineales bacterium]
MEETVELDLEPAPESTPSEAAQAESIAATPIVVPEPMPAIDSTQKIMRKKKSEP